MRSSVATILAALTAFSHAKTITVDVGEKGLSFDPDSVTADVGDVVEFKFYGQHSVVQGSFDAPCNTGSINDGFSSGVVAGSSSGDGDVFKVTINSTDPIYYYCGVPSHCQAKMVGAINPSSTDTVAAYQSAAAGTSSTNGPTDVQGGVFGASDDDDDDDSGSSSSSSASASSASASSTASKSSAAAGSTSQAVSSTTSATSTLASASTTANVAAGLGNEWLSYSALIMLTGGVVALMA